MSLLCLPAELRMNIYQYLPDLAFFRHVTISPSSPLTPAICRSSHVLREETLPLYAKTAFFIIQTDEKGRLDSWLRALEANAIFKVQGLQLSRHWKLEHPTRWQGHVGFYIRLQRTRDIWSCTVGTYPYANDMRGMRLESVEFLKRVVMKRLRPKSAWMEAKGLVKADVEFLVRAMNVVASHPIPTSDMAPGEDGNRRRQIAWARMKMELDALMAKTTAISFETLPE